MIRLIALLLALAIPASALADYTVCRNGVCYRVRTPVQNVLQPRRVVTYSQPTAQSHGSAGGTFTYGTSYSSLERKVKELEQTIDGLQSRLRKAEDEAFERIDRLETAFRAGGFSLSDSKVSKLCPCGPDCKCNPCLCSLSDCRVQPATLVAKR